MKNPNRTFIAFASPEGSDEAMEFMADYARRLADQFHSVAVIDLSEYSYMEYRFPDVKMKPCDEGISFCTPKTMSDLVYALKRASATRRELNSNFLAYMMSRAYVSLSEKRIKKIKKGIFGRKALAESNTGNEAADRTPNSQGYIDIIRDAINPLDMQELTYKEMISVIKAAGDMKYDYILINISRLIRDIKAMSQSGIEEMIDRLIIVSGESEIDGARALGLMSSMKCFPEFYERFCEKLQIVKDMNMFETLTGVVAGANMESVIGVVAGAERGTVAGVVASAGTGIKTGVVAGTETVTKAGVVAGEETVTGIGVVAGTKTGTEIDAVNYKKNSVDIIDMSGNERSFYENVG